MTQNGLSRGERTLWTSFGCNMEVWTPTGTKTPSLLATSWFWVFFRRFLKEKTYLGNKLMLDICASLHWFLQSFCCFCSKYPATKRKFFRLPLNVGFDDEFADARGKYECSFSIKDARKFINDKNMLFISMSRGEAQSARQICAKLLTIAKHGINLLKIFWLKAS